ncbi:MAG: hypothetical protein GXY98_03385 [Erysipelothrix sp.]|nr:hypothetical protein [Erysipelothrix sp.]
MKQKKSKLLLVSWILGALYIIYLFAYFGGLVGNTTGGEQVGSLIASTIVMPHAICAALAVLFNILGWSMNNRGFTLTGAILYAVSIVLMPLYFMFVIIQMILSFVGYAKMKSPINYQVAN